MPSEAFLLAGATDAVNGEVFNVGGDEHFAHRELVDLLVRTAGTGRYRFVEWPAEKKVIDIGSFYADSTLFKTRTGWAPRGRPGRRPASHARLLPHTDGALCLTRAACVFNALKPGEDAADVAAAIARVVASGWFVLGPEVEQFEAEFAAACGGAHARRRRHRHRRHHADPARARHRPRRRGDHAAALGRLLRAGGDDGRRAPGVRRHRSRSA